MKKLTAACAGALAVLSRESFNNVADAWIAHNNNALTSGNNGDSFSSSPTSMLEVQWGETYKYVKPFKTTNGLEFVFETILGTLFDLKPDYHSHCGAANLTFDLQYSTESGKKTGIVSIDDCQQECHSDSNCRGAVYQPEDRTCRFFSRVSGVKNNIHCAVVLPTCNGACFHDGYNLSGIQMFLGSAPNAFICQAFCRSDSSCYAFSWNKRTGQCFRHGDEVMLLDHNDYVSGRRDLCTGLLPPTEAGNSIYSNSASRGNHFSLVPGVQSWEACRIQCLTLKKCVSFDYDTRRRSCYMKSARGTRHSSSGVQTGTRYNDSSCHKKGYLFVGNNTNAIRDINHPSECHTECYANSSCSKWSYYRKTKMCLLFSSASAIKFLSGAYSGPKEPCRNDAQYQFRYPDCTRKGIKYGGTPFETVGAGDPPACQSKCFANLNCEAFTFDVSTRKCHFHLAVAVKTQTPNDNFVSGPRKCGACHSNNKYYSGEQVGDVDDVETADECQLLCQAKGYCAYWSYAVDSKECTFYKDGAVEKNGRNNITGPKYCDGACDLRGFQATTPDFGYSYNAGKKNLQDCRNACRNNENCVTFTHHSTYNTCILNDATNLRNLTSGQNMGLVFGFRHCASCIREGVAYKATKEAYLWSILANNPQECQERCELMETCTYFSFNVKSKQCSLLSGKTEEETGEHLVSGPAQCVPKASCFLKDVGLTDVDNISTNRLPTVGDCQERCKETVSCKFFTYDYTKKLCTLKSGGLLWKDHLRTQPQKGFLTGTKKCIRDGDEKSICEGHDYSAFGRNLDPTLQAKDNKECRRLCIEEPRCRSWVFNKVSKECHRKALTGPPMQHLFVPDMNIFAGSRLGCPRCLRAGMAYSGQKLMVVELESEIMCQQLCEPIDECEVFTFVKEICTLFRRSTGSQSASTHTISGPKHC